jgi:hypothetical protein
MTGSLTYIKGDATRPAGDGPKVIPHVVNNVPGWGAGFVLALSRKWPEPERSYRFWAQDPSKMALGVTQPVQVEPDVWVMNMLAQRGYWNGNPATPAIDYDALKVCLQSVSLFAYRHGASIHCPRLGAELAGGDWRVIEQIIQETLVKAGHHVTVYDYSG